MPTGYTYGIEDGTITSLRQYALKAARAFSMHDADDDEPFPERIEPAPHFLGWKTEQQDRLAKLLEMSPDEIKQAAAADLARAQGVREKHIAEAREATAKYNRMLALVQGWIVPTYLDDLKAFMLQQISISIPREPTDGLGGIDEAEFEPGAWHRNSIADAQDKIARYEEEYRKELVRTADRNAWLAILRQSLPPEEEST